MRRTDHANGERRLAPRVCSAAGLAVLFFAVPASGQAGGALTSARELDLGDYHLKAGPGWKTPAGLSKGKWVFTYSKPLKNGPSSSPTPLHADFYSVARPYIGEVDRRDVIEEFRAAIWSGQPPAERSDTIKVAGVKAEYFLQKGNAGWRFYVFPYNDENVYAVYVFSPGDTPELPPEARDLLSSVKLKPPGRPAEPAPPPAAAPPANAKASKDYLKNVGGGLNLFPAGAERQLGLSTSTQLNRQLTLLKSAPVQGYVESLGRRLVAASRNPQLQCQFFVVNTREVNAFALPGCFVYVNAALIGLAQNEGQLAGVMSHEIGHVVAHHAARQISKQLLILGVVTGAAELADRKSKGLAEVVAAAGGAAILLAKLKYTRDDEHQADALGVETMAAAGYDPHDLVDFFRLMEPGSALNLDARILGILNTHPVTADREKVLAAQIAGMSYRPSAEIQGINAFNNCRGAVARWPLPAAGREVTLSAALASAGLASDDAK